MARRQIDEIIADYAERSRGEFFEGQLRIFICEIKSSMRVPNGLYFNVGDSAIVLENDAGIISMRKVKILSRYGVGTISRVTLAMNTKPV